MTGKGLIRFSICQKAGAIDAATADLQVNHQVREDAERPPAEPGPATHRVGLYTVLHHVQITLFKVLSIYPLKEWCIISTVQFPQFRAN